MHVVWLYVWVERVTLSVEDMWCDLGVPLLNSSMLACLTTNMHESTVVGIPRASGNEMNWTISIRMQL